LGTVPEFDESGVLPSGDYKATFEDLRRSPLVRGAKDIALDRGWRRHLLEQAEILVKQLWQVGITEVYLDGSFVEAKAHPNDIDGYFECDLHYLASGQLERDLNALDPYKVWTWDPRSRRQYRNYAKRQLPMWHRYRVELYPHYGQGAGITDSRGHELQFPSAFRRRRFSEEAKGIVKVVRK
jgi:hypothetical protein